MDDHASMPHTATDGDADGGNVLFEIWLLSRATTALLDHAVQASGLDADEFGVYSVLTSGEGMAPTELARWMSAPATTVSSYVKRFEARGHVRRVPNPDDGRSYLVQLTDEGRRAHAAAGALFLPVLGDVNRVVGDDLADVRQRIGRLHRIVAGQRRPA